MSKQYTGEFRNMDAETIGQNLMYEIQKKVFPYALDGFVEKATNEMKILAEYYSAAAKAEIDKK